MVDSGHQVSLSITSSVASSDHVGHQHSAASFWHDVLDRSAAATLLLDEFGVIGVESAQWSRHTGRMKNGSIGYRLFDLVHVTNVEGVRDAFLKMAEGELSRVSFEFSIELSQPLTQPRSVRTYSATGVNALLDATIGAIIVTVFDITERKALVQTLRYNANHDPLTGLTNRRAVLRTLTQWISEAPQIRAKPAVMLLDLDGFKGVNDAYGHVAGDALLVEVANRLKKLTLDRLASRGSAATNC